MILYRIGKPNGSDRPEQTDDTGHGGIGKHRSDQNIQIAYQLFRDSCLKHPV